MDAVRLHLPQYEEIIKKLMLSDFGMKDELVWLPERSGVYSTRSGYALHKVNVEQEADTFSWKACVWQVKTSPKLKHLLWKIKNLALPVGSNLLRRGIEVEGRYKRCGVVETERHVLLQCPFARRVWELVPGLHKPDPESVSSPEGLLQACTRMINLPLTGLNASALYPWIFWYLWIGRNKLVFENRGGSEEELVSIAIREARIWQSAQQGKTKTLQTKQAQLPQVCGNSQDVQCFVDAAWNAGTNRGGFDCILKDRNNGMTHQFSSNRSNVGSALVAEAIAIKAGLMAAQSLGLRNLIIRSYSKSLVMAITRMEKIVEAQSVLFDISYLCNFFSSVVFTYVPRLSNVEADTLAKAALLRLSDV